MLYEGLIFVRLLVIFIGTIQLLFPLLFPFLRETKKRYSDIAVFGCVV